MSKAKIYTRFGDQGKTRLVDSACVDKFDPRVEAYGTVDELNSVLGLALSQEPSTSLAPTLQKIQNHLFRAGSLLACGDDQVKKNLPMIEASHVKFLESQIDSLSEALPELKNFILPGGSVFASQLHVARTVCRRAERKTAELLQHDSSLAEILIYVNRLSDLLFVAARWSNFKSGKTDVAWDKSL